MVELIVVCIVGALILFGWIAIWVGNEKSLIKGVIMAIGLPLMVVSMVALVVYVIHCFIVVLS